MKTRKNGCRRYMKNWNPDISSCKKIITFLVVFSFFTLFAQESHALECYGDFNPGDPEYDSIEVPKHTRTIGLIEQGVCEPKAEENTWYEPRIRIAYKPFRRTFRRNLGPNECKWIFGLRFCARMAYPKEGENVHGNRTGEHCSTSDTTEETICKGMKPQLCAYVDPMDGGDTNGGFSPYHKRTDVTTLFSTTTATATGAVVGTILLPGIGTALGAAIGGLVNAIKSRKNHFVTADLGCIDRPMAAGPPVWSNEQWDRVYFPTPFLDYDSPSTFRQPAIRVYFCQIDRPGGVISENVLCEFMKDANGEYLRGPNPQNPSAGPFDLTPAPGIRVHATRSATIAPGVPDAEVVTSGNITGPWQRRFEARISFEYPDSICLFKTNEANRTAVGPPATYATGRPVEILQGCIPRPGYMPMPRVQEVPMTADALGDIAIDANPDRGIMGLTLRVSFDGMPGSIDLQYIGDVDTVGGTVSAEDAQPLPRCELLHQIPFCVAPGPISSPIVNYSDTATMPDPDDPTAPDINPNGARYRAWMCVEGYDTAPLVAASPYVEPSGNEDDVVAPVYDETGQPIFEPPLYIHETCVPGGAHCTVPCTRGVDCIINPEAKPVTRQLLYSKLIRGYDSDPTDTAVDDMTLPPHPSSGNFRPAGDIPNNYVPNGVPFDNLNAYSEIGAGGVVLPPQVTLEVPSYHYNPPMSDVGPQDPFLITFAATPPPDVTLPAKRPVDVNDPYYIDGTANGAIDGPGRFDYDQPTINPPDTDFGYNLGDIDELEEYNELQKTDPAILRPMTPLELGMCAEVTLDVEKSYTLEDKAIFTFPTEEGLLRVNWDNDISINEVIRPHDLVKNTLAEDTANFDDGQLCSKLFVEVWGAGGGGTSQPDRSGDFSGGAGAYISAEYDLKELDLIDKTLEISVGLGGRVIYLGDEDIVGIDGTRSTFGPNQKMIIANGGKGRSARYFIDPITFAGQFQEFDPTAPNPSGGLGDFVDDSLADPGPGDSDDYSGGLYTACQAGCLHINSIKGLDGAGHDTDCAVLEGGYYYTGETGDAATANQYVGDGALKCDHTAGSDDAAARDPDLFIDTTLAINATGIFNPENLNFSEDVNAIIPSADEVVITDPMGNVTQTKPVGTLYPGVYQFSTDTLFRHPAAGGCVADKCDSTCPPSLKPCTLRLPFGAGGPRCSSAPAVVSGRACLLHGNHSRQRIAGLAAPGSHGRVKVQCIEYQTIDPLGTVDTTTIPTP